MGKKTIVISLLLTSILCSEELTVSTVPFVVEKSTFTEKEPLFKFNKKKWNDIRSKIEKNLPVYEESVSTTPAKLPPVASPTTIEFIEGTQLTIAGRKLIGMELKTVQYPKRPDSLSNRTDLNMRQELQVRIHGKVGKNVDVNIDIDDTQPDKRDILIIYRGEGVEAAPGAVGYKAKPGAVIQEIAFGDVQLTLPNSEFVGYSRQVFGIKAIAQYNTARLYLIASQSKGNFETQRFTGTTKFQREIIPDTAYKRKKYYKIAFGNDKIKKDSVVIYLDTLDPTRDPNTLTKLTAQAYHSSTFTYTSQLGFEKLASGRDYVVDYAQGYVIFNLPNRSIQDNWVIAIDYIDERTGLSLREKLGTTNYILIKDINNTPDVTTELWNRYSLAAKNIIRDNGTGNFILKIVDKSNRPLDPQKDKIQPGDKPVPVYKPGNLGDIIVDFENGEFYFISERPFADNCYDKNPQNAINTYNILVEYRYRIKTYQLKPFIVPQSERVLLDGKLLQREVDYFIDYDSGFLTFLKEEQITENSVIEVSYEYSMLGLQGGETLAGGRLEVPLAGNKLFLGGSWLSNLPSKGTNVPDVRTTPSSLNVWESDTRLVDFKVPFIPLTINSFSAEYAESNKDPNIWDKAVVENMEGITLEDNVSTYRELWHYSSTVIGEGYVPGKYENTRFVGGELGWENEEVYVRDINPNKVSTLEKQQVLRINYDLFKSSEVAMVYSFSKIGLDFTKKLYIDLELYSDTGGGKLYLDLGQVKEDIDNDGYLDTEDKNHNGRLDIDEDVGFEYNLGDTKYNLFAGNGTLDTEDLDGDNILKTFDSLAGSYYIGELNFNSWISTRVPIEVTDLNLWSTVKHLRLRIQGHGKRGVLKIAKISVVANKWQNNTPQKCKIYAVNNENTPNYKKLTELEEYQSLYGSQFTKEKTVEQALAVEYNFTSSTDTASVYLLYTRAQDFTYHRKFNFFLFNDGNEIEFKLRAYTDNDNYFEYSTHTISWSNEWKKFYLHQIDINFDGVPDIWSVDSLDPQQPRNPNGGICSKITKAGTAGPSLQAISKLEIVIRPTKNFQKGVLYINDIYLSESWKRKGIAKKLELNFSIPGWASFGSRYRAVDRRFETFTSPITNQDNTTTAGSFNFTKFRFCPISFQAEQMYTVTPSAIKSGELVSQIEEGQRSITKGSVNTSLIIPKLPVIGVNYTKSVSSISVESRNDIDDTYRFTFNYSNPISKIIPINNISTEYSEGKLFIFPWDVVRSTPFIDNSRNVSVTIPFNFWNKLTLSLSATNKNVFTELRKYKDKIDTGIVIPKLSEKTDIVDYWTKLVFFPLINFPQTYPEVIISSFAKTSFWSTSVNSTIDIIPSFRPSLSYKIDITENYNFPISDVKDVIRNASGSSGVSFAPRSLLDIKPIRSLNIGYNFTLTVADKYEKLSKETEIVDIYNFRKLENLWYQTEISTSRVFRTNWFERKEHRISSSWNIFEGIEFKGILSGLKRTSLQLNYNDTEETKEQTGTLSYTYTKVWPDITTTFYELERFTKLVYKKDVITDTRLDLRYIFRTTEIRNVSKDRHITHREGLSFNLFKEYQIVTSYENTYADSYSLILNTTTQKTNNHYVTLQIGLPFFGHRLTPRYEFRKEYTVDSRQLPTRDVITHTLGVRYYADIVPQQGVRLPIFGTIPLHNRLRVDTNLQYARRENTLEVRDNTDKITFSSNADYDVSKYISLRVGLGTGLNFNRAVETETNYTFSINSQLTIIF